MVLGGYRLLNHKTTNLLPRFPPSKEDFAVGVFHAVETPLQCPGRKEPRHTTHQIPTNGAFVGTKNTLSTQLKIVCQRPGREMNYHHNILGLGDML